MYLSTASGSSRENRASKSSRDKPVCFDKVSNTKLRRCHGFVGACADPGVSRFTVTALLETIHKFAEPAAQDPTGTGTAETAT